ncbi:hypothetical protein [Erwinia amylovora]|uniref:hypothetical protein n=1 Tax=Erwinia amylovora TaxID=552 RepID=UPI001443B2BA
MNTLPATQITMTSTELVEYINAERESAATAAGVNFPGKGHKRLRHADFMAKAPRVLGETHSAKCLLERKERPSSRHGTRQFWSVTSAGLIYGKNITSPGNPRETQPHFYESRFPRLLDRIIAARGA